MKGYTKRYVVAKRRSEQGKIIRRQYKNDKGVPYQLVKGYSLMLGGYSNTITTFCSVDNWIMEIYGQSLCVASRGRGDNNAQHFEGRTDKCTNTITSVVKDNLIMNINNNSTKMEYKEHPTKEDLLEYFGARIRIRKMTPNEAGRLMGLDDNDIEKINAYPFTSYAEGEKALANADDKERRLIKRESISKTAKYKCYGNSIVIQVLEAIFKSLFIPGQSVKNRPIQKSLFDF